MLNSTHYLLSGKKKNSTQYHTITVATQHNITLLQSQLTLSTKYYGPNARTLPSFIPICFFFFGRKEFRPIVMTMAYTFVFLECIYISEKKSNILFEKPKKRR